MKITKYVFNLLIIFIIGGCSIYFSIGDHWNQVVDVFYQASWKWLFIMVLIMFLYYLLEALSLWLLTHVYYKKYRLFDALINAMTGIFFSGITPFASGGQFAQVYVFNKQGIVPTYSASILLMCFICYQIVLVLYTSIVMIFKYQFFIQTQPTMLPLALIGFFINFSVIVGLFIAAKSKMFQDFITHTLIKGLNKVNIVKNYQETCDKIERYLSDFRDQLNILQHHKIVLLQSCLCHGLKLTLLYSMPFLSIKALNISIDGNMFWELVGLCSFIYMINAFLPIPGASGGSEGIYMLLFSFLGSIGVSSSMFLWRFISYYLGLILGGIVFIIYKAMHINEVKE